MKKCNNFALSFDMKKRNTQGKQLVRTILEDAKSALSQDLIEAKLQGEIDRVTIYRILNGFVEDGLVHKIVSDDGKSYFALCNGCTEAHHEHDHAHFKCTSCNRVECLPTPIHVMLPSGYSVRHSNHFLSGVCGACR